MTASSAMLFLLVGGVAPLELAGEGKPVEIVFLAGDKSEHAGYLRVRAGDTAVNGLQLLAETLRSDAGTIIPRAAIALEAPSQIPAFAVRDIKVTIGEVTTPGVYVGSAVLTWGAEELPLSLSATVRPAPVIIVPAAPLVFQAVNLEQLPSWLGGWVLPPRLVAGERAFTVENPSAAAVQVESVTVVAIGERTGQPLPPTSVAFKAGQRIDSHGLAAMTLNLLPGGLAPDRYKGSLAIRVADLDRPVVVPFQLDVRGGLLWAVLAIGGGVLLGRLAMLRDLPRRMQLVDRLRDLEKGLDQLRFALAKSMLGPTLLGLWQKLDRAETPAEIEPELTQLETAEQQLLLVERLELAAGAQTPSAKQAAQNAKTQLVRLNFALATTEIQNLRNAIAGEEPMVAAGGSTPPPARFRMKLLALRKYLWIARCALFLLIVYTGFDSMYVRAGDTFGSGGMADYMGLMLWGLSADVAQRTLETFTRRS